MTPCFAHGLDNPLWVAHMPTQPTTTVLIAYYPVIHSV
jgi:hypothetical protein